MDDMAFNSQTNVHVNSNGNMMKKRRNHITPELQLMHRKSNFGDKLKFFLLQPLAQYQTIFRVFHHILKINEKKLKEASSPHFA